MPIALIIAILLSGGIGFASEKALPGDVLYPIKVNLNEKFESAFTFSKKQEDFINKEHENKRIDEIEKLVSKGKITLEQKNQMENSVKIKIDDNSNSKTIISTNKKDDDSDDNKEQIRGRDHDEDDEGDDDEEDEDDDRDNNRGGKTVTPTPNPTPTPQPNPTPSPTPTPTVTSYTLAQVATHNTASNCWSVVNGGVYNLTSWIGQHPGGQSAIKSMCGLDASADFNGQHGGQARPVSELAGFKIGVLK